MEATMEIIRIFDPNEKSSENIFLLKESSGLHLLCCHIIKLLTAWLIIVLHTRLHTPNP